MKGTSSMYHHFVEVNGILAFNSKSKLACLRWIQKNAYRWDHTVVLISRPKHELGEC
jgi:hypothetical protein